MKPIAFARTGPFMLLIICCACGSSIEDVMVDKAADMAKEEAIAAAKALRQKVEELEGENEALGRSLTTIKTRYEELETRYDELETSAEDLEAKAEAAEQNLAIERSSWSRLYAE